MGKVYEASMRVFSGQGRILKLDCGILAYSGEYNKDHLIEHMNRVIFDELYHKLLNIYRSAKEYYSSKCESSLPKKHIQSLFCLTF